MLDISIPGLKVNTVKDAIVSILASQFPLSTKELIYKVKKDFKRNVSYQSVHKSLNELVSAGVVDRRNDNTYLLHNAWILELEKFSLFLKDAYQDALLKSQQTKKSQLARIRFYSSPDDFYKVLSRLVTTEKELRLAAKTPALILSSEAKMTKYRKIYFDNLVSRIQDGSLKVKYLFATELTKEKILQNKDWEAIKRFEEYQKYPNLSLRHAPIYSVIASAIGNNDFMFGLASPYTHDQVGIIHLSSFQTKHVKEIYDRLFANAKEPYEFVQRLKKLKK